ncbi:PLP-dependent aminotransferase family protein [Peribacillus saganii]|uniref:PLP-dependent aminotransferase family protein n=1 Tax=Peribacillus saganii TaxID=2303992 RepID=A0A372LRZ3_9BACI|nr:PLP-dependent aminotransferase family protein [Peribacillus saganii]RFU70959.1 PLP-dependent aminotransferase family protein [Peribacillus saganii]
MDMLSCDLDRTNEIPLYEQLYLYIKREIIEGRLHYQTKLPSKRKLADFLEISQNTVEAAYEQLTSEGYLEVLPRKGYFVMASEDLEYVGKLDVPIKTDNVKNESFRYHFHPSIIDTAGFPFQQWRKYAKNVMDERNSDLLLLGEPQGEFELRTEIADYLYHARGVKCSPEQIVLGAGIEILLQQLVLLWDAKTKYGVEDPGYHLIPRIMKTYGRDLYPLQVDNSGVKVSEIARAGIDVVYVTPSRHFPYGTILSVNRRNKLLNWAAEADGRYIIEDDYDSEYRYSGKSIPSLQSMDQKGKVIYMGSFSKSLMPSIRISYMVLPHQLMERFRSELSFNNSSVSRMDQHILAQFMRHGDFGKHLNRMRKIYRRKLEKITEMLKHYADKIQVIGENSGLHIVLVVQNGLDETLLVKKAETANIRVYPLSQYTFEKKYEGPPQIILGFAGIPEEDLDDAITSLMKSWGI